MNTHLLPFCPCVERCGSFVAQSPALFWPPAAHDQDCLARFRLHFPHKRPNSTWLWHWNAGGHVWLVIAGCMASFRAQARSSQEWTAFVVRTASSCWETPAHSNHVASPSELNTTLLLQAQLVDAAHGLTEMLQSSMVDSSPQAAVADVVDKLCQVQLLHGAVRHSADLLRQACDHVLQSERLVHALVRLSHSTL